MEYLNSIGKNSKSAAKVLSIASSETKNNALCAIAKALVENSEEIIKSNRTDLENGKANGLSDAMLDRLMLDEGRIEKIASSILEIVALPDPVGKTLSGTTRPNGLHISKVSVPLGVIAVIFEARPNVTADAAALCIKSGNTVILRGGKEAINSNIAMAKIMRTAVSESGLPEDCIQLIDRTDRETASELMKLNEYVDVLIPRGGKGLIQLL